MRTKITPGEFMALSCRVDRLSRMANSIKNLEERLDKLETNQEKASKKVMSSKEAAFYLGISKPELYRLVHFHNLPFSKPNRKFYFDRHQIDEWVKDNSIDSKKYIFL